ncbi:MAG TPA: PKD domain-containing protein [Methanosarcina sp.]|nr:PKD domain-containing protein [Methanosarcina sp.]
MWADDRNGNWDIYMYDLSTKKERRITTNPSDSYCPAIYGNRIVWMDLRNGNSDIYMYDLSTSTETQVTTNKLGQGWPDIYGDRIVWDDYRNGNSDIYMGAISTVHPIAAFSASPTSGKAPLNVLFTDKSTGSPIKWKWSFGDGKTSTDQNPQNIGIYRKETIR